MNFGNAARNLSDREIGSATEDTSFGIGTMDFSAFGNSAAVIDLGKVRQSRLSFRSPRWTNAILPTICQFIDLPVGWDSYAGQPLKLETGMFALKILNGIMTSQTPIPDAVPTSEGGIQFEWHGDNFELEIYFAAPYDCELWYRDHRSGLEQSMTLSSDFTKLAKLIGRLRERQSA
jgi:hypothetical protein